MVRPLQRQAEQEVAATKQEPKLVIAPIQLSQCKSLLSLTETLDFAQIGQFGHFTAPLNC